MSTNLKLSLQVLGLAALAYWVFTGPYVYPKEKPCTKTEIALRQSHCSR